MARNGHIMIHRSILDWEWYKDIPTKTLFLHLLLIANYSPNNYKGVEIGVGQLTTSLQALADSTGLSKQQIRTSLKKLVRTQEITHKTTNQYSLITILNYSNYQHTINENNTVNDYVSNTSNNTQITNKKQTNNNQITPIKNIRNKNILYFINLYKKEKPIKFGEKIHWLNSIKDNSNYINLTEEEIRYLTSYVFSNGTMGGIK